MCHHDTILVAFTLGSDQCFSCGGVRSKGPLAGVHAVEPCRRAHLPAAHEDGVAQRRLRRGEAWILKEDLRSIYAEAKNAVEAEALLKAWIDRTSASDVSELETMARTMKQNLDGVLGFWKFRGASNARTEGFNNKIRWLIKQAYGYRDYKYLRLKIFDLPNIKPRDSDC